MQNYTCSYEKRTILTKKISKFLKTKLSLITELDKKHDMLNINYFKDIIKNHVFDTTRWDDSFMDRPVNDISLPILNELVPEELERMNNMKRLFD